MTAGKDNLSLIRNFVLSLSRNYKFAIGLRSSKFSSTAEAGSRSRKYFKVTIRGKVTPSVDARSKT